MASREVQVSLNIEELPGVKKLIADLTADRDAARAALTEREARLAEYAADRDEWRDRGTHAERQLKAVRSRLNLWRGARDPLGRHPASCLCVACDVLNKDLEWEYEPIPSSRDDGFRERTRFGYMEALRLARHQAPLVTINGRTGADLLGDGDG